MSALSSLVIAADGTKIDLGIDANKGVVAALTAADPLGIVAKSKLLEKQTLAITKPDEYIKNRNDKIRANQEKLYKEWMKDYQDQITAGYTDAQARLEADTVALGKWNGIMAAVDLEFPLTALGTAVERQSSINRLISEEKGSILKSEREVAPEKRTYRKRKKSTRGKSKGKK